ncbi:hypothetical protein BSKO_06912 [Bryopsis sp. KO-2023]|nr:hypothetical protein BSKO_06912 [Bryopsis sp. KO-2023]
MLSNGLNSGPQFHDFARGSWRLNRTLRYVKGGLSGSFAGTAKFQPPVAGPGVSNSKTLLYSEEGSFTVEESKQVLKAYRSYLFRCDAYPVKVYFVLKKDPLDVGDFFHDLEFSTSENGSTAKWNAAFEHLCVKDLYSGRFSVHDDDSFEWNWRIVGPKKDGEICTHYTRIE